MSSAVGESVPCVFKLKALRAGHNLGEMKAAVTPSPILRVLRLAAVPVFAVATFLSATGVPSVPPSKVTPPADNPADAKPDANTTAPKIIIPPATSTATTSTSTTAAAARPPTAASLAVAPMRTQETQWFSIAADETSALAFVAEIARETELCFGRELRWERPAATPRIEAVLTRPAHANWLGHSRIEVNRDTGRVTLRLRWADGLRVSEVEEALARALLVAAAKTLRPRDAAAPPGWLVAALAFETQLTRASALMDHQIRLARKTPPPTLAALTAPAGDFPDTLRAPAFWFWRHLRREFAAENRPMREAIAALVCGEPLEKLLAREFPEMMRDPDRRAVWWPAGYTVLTRESEALVQTPAESHEYLENALRFVFATGVDDELCPPWRLPALHGLSAAREAANLRRRTLLRDIWRANPVWHNAWVASGRFLEKFCDDSTDPAELVRSWETAAAEIETARKISTEIRQLLGEK
ncbi:MAG: hypothetical protein LBT53_00840 [Puniceicoccales bacterium]|nr:hypothetical protein [Puniceicoccales bacterium]